MERQQRQKTHSSDEITNDFYIDERFTLNGIYGISDTTIGSRLVAGCDKREVSDSSSAHQKLSAFCALYVFQPKI